MWERDLFDEIRGMRESMERAFGGFEGIKGFRAPVFKIRETETGVIAEVELPGMSKEEIELNVTKEAIEVRAEKRSEKKEKKEKGFSYYSSASAFYRRMTLPVEVKPEEAKATYKNGILRVEMPKAKKVLIGKKVQIE